MFDEERLNPHGVVSYRTIKNNSSTLESEEELSARITDVLTKFQFYFWLNFKLKREQEIAVESMLMNQDVLVVLSTAYGKSKYYKHT